MTQRTAERVLEISNTTGTGPIRLVRPVIGYRTLADAGCVNGDTVDLMIESVSSNGAPTGDWEIGTYTWGTGGILTRTTISSSSNGGAAVDWPNGTRWVRQRPGGVDGGGNSASPLRTLISNLGYAYANEIWNLVGDSTGNETTEWPYLALTGMLPQLPSNAYVTYRLYDDAAGRYGAPVVLQVGAGEPYVTVGADGRGWGCQRAFVGVIGGADLDTWVDVALTAYTGSNQALMTQYGGAVGRNVFWLYLNSTGVPQLFWSADGGTTGLTAGGTTNVTGLVSAGGRLAIRATLDVDNGAGGYTVTFYTSANGGAVWTQLGAAVTGGAVTSIFNNATQPVEIGSRNGADSSNTAGNQGPAQGAFYRAHLSSTIGGASQLPASVREMGASNGMSGVKGGGPSFEFWNGSIAGASITYFMAGDRLARMVPRYSQGVFISNTSHNEGAAWDPAAFATSVASFIAAAKLRSVDPSILVCTQNPQTAPRTAVQIDGQARRAVAWRSLAQANRWGVIDTFARVDWSSGVDPADGVHPVKPATSSGACALAAYQGS